MTIVYWDFLSGNDSTGDGSAGNPYKTLSKATTGLTGDDDVRCAKSPDPANLGCNLTFTDGSTSVATASDLTSVLGAHDFVSLNTAGETWWEISSINSTTITLVVAYRGTGGTGTGYKRGITGSIAGVTVADGSSSTAVHTISASGTSGATLKLSFGWNLSGTPAQDGQTFFFQSNATKGGRAIYASSKGYIEIDGARFGLLRYDTGIYGYNSSNWTITSCTCNGNSNYGIYLSGGCSNIVAYGYAHDESTWSNAGKINNWTGNGQKIVSIQESESGGAARNRVYFYGGYTQDNAVDARSGKCLQFNPKSATYWIEQSFFVPAAASTARTVAIYLKDDSGFDGSVWLELWFNGVRIAGPTEKTMTTSYVQESITGASGDIPVDGVLELKVLVYGTAGCVYADDISYS